MNRSRTNVLTAKRYSRSERLTAFGAFVRKAREAKVASQMKAVDLLKEHAMEVSQSWVAQLETGRITDPGPETLRKLGSAYGVTYDEIVYALVRDKYRLTDRSFVTELSRERWLTVGELFGPEERVGNLPGLLEHGVRGKAGLLKAEILDANGLMKWQADFPDLSEIWIVTPAFHEYGDVVVTASVISNLKRGARYLFFLPRTEIEDGKPFWRFTLQVRQALQRSKITFDKQVRVLPLDPSEGRWMTADAMIVNPTDQKTRVGFLGIRHERRLFAALRFGDRDLEALVDSMLPFVVQSLGTEWLRR